MYRDKTTKIQWVRTHLLYNGGLWSKKKIFKYTRYQNHLIYIIFWSFLTTLPLNFPPTSTAKVTTKSWKLFLSNTILGTSWINKMMGWRPQCSLEPREGTTSLILHVIDSYSAELLYFRCALLRPPHAEDFLNEMLCWNCRAWQWLIPTLASVSIRHASGLTITRAGQAAMSFCKMILLSCP